jgi:Raf kinase inhibitor-like YbhB/YbcL family protein
MKKTIAIIFIVLGLLSVGMAEAEQMILVSPQLEPGGRLDEAQVFSGFGCTGKNISPALQWKNAPINTKSFAVTVYDPDAPTGSGWWHWLIFNIPANVDRLPENAGNPVLGLAPKGSIQSKTDFGTPGFGGACPPVGSKPHRYIFTIYALNTDKIDAGTDASGAMVGFMLRQHSIAKATVTFYYSR